MMPAQRIEGIRDVEAGDAVNAQRDGIVDVAQDFVNPSTDTVLLREKVVGRTNRVDDPFRCKTSEGLTAGDRADSVVFLPQRVQHGTPKPISSGDVVVDFHRGNQLQKEVAEVNRVFDPLADHSKRPS